MQLLVQKNIFSIEIVEITGCKKCKESIVDNKCVVNYWLTMTMTLWHGPYEETTQILAPINAQTSHKYSDEKALKIFWVQKCMFFFPLPVPNVYPLHTS